jgi:hypothetical protein
VTIFELRRGRAHARGSPSRLKSGWRRNQRWLSALTDLGWRAAASLTGSSPVEANEVDLLAMNVLPGTLFLREPLPVPGGGLALPIPAPRRLESWG